MDRKSALFQSESAVSSQLVEKKQLRSASGNIPVPKRLIAPSHLDSISCAVESADALKHSESLHVVMFKKGYFVATGFVLIVNIYDVQLFLNSIFIYMFLV